MKKIISLFLVIFSLTMLLTSCSNGGGTTHEKPKGKDQYSLRLGLVCIDNSSVGEAKNEITAAAILIDEAGKIADVEIDCMENTMSIEGGSAGTGGEYKTKGELGESYGMKEASKIDKEWEDQTEYFCEKLIGKSAEDIEKLELDDAGRIQAADISAGCTISVSQMKTALTKAFSDPYPIEFSADKKPNIKLSALTEDNTSADATDSKEGSSAMFTTFAALAEVDERIYGAIIDTSEPTVPFDSKGTPMTMKYEGTKRELGKNYGMLIASTIGKEWYEQAEYFCDYIVGMTEDEVAAINVDAVGRAGDADLLAGCTIAVKSYVAVVRKAID